MPGIMGRTRRALPIPRPSVPALRGGGHALGSGTRTTPRHPRGPCGWSAVAVVSAFASHAKHLRHPDRPGAVRLCNPFYHQPESERGLVMISRHRVDRWGWFALRSAAVLVGLAGALLFPALALAQSVPNVVGVYRWFAQNIDPSIPPVSVLLTIGRQDEEGNIFGVVFILPYLEEDSLYQGQGKLLDAQGSFKLRGTNSAGKEVRVTGTIQGLVHQGALLLASYRSTPATGGPVDQGVTNLLRSFVPPDPVTPFTGTWRGTFVSDLNRQQRTVDLQITKQ